ADHRVRRVTRQTRWSTDTERCEAGKLAAGDRVLLNNHRAGAQWPGARSAEEGFLLGLLVGGGALKHDAAVLSVWSQAAAVTGAAGCEAGTLAAGDRAVLNTHRAGAQWPGARSAEEGVLLGLLVGEGTLKHDAAVLSVWSQAAAVNAVDNAPVALMDEALRCARALPHRSDFAGWTEVAGRGEHRLKLAALRDLALELGMVPGDKAITPAMEKTSSDFHRGFLRGLFDADGSVQGSQAKGVSVRLAQSDLPRLQAAQRMLMRLGIASTIYRDRRSAGETLLPDGRGGLRAYPTQAQHELVI